MGGGGTNLTITTTITTLYLFPFFFCKKVGGGGAVSFYTGRVRVVLMFSMFRVGGNYDHNWVGGCVRRLLVQFLSELDDGKGIKEE